VSLDAWRNRTSKVARKTALMKRIVLRMSGKLLLVTLDTWSEREQQLQSERQEQNRKSHVLVRILK